MTRPVHSYALGTTPTTRAALLVTADEQQLVAEQCPSHLGWQAVPDEMCWMTLMEICPELTPFLQWQTTIMREPLTIEKCTIVTV